MDASWLEIDLSALDQNVAQWRSWLGPARLCAVVKADGYGLGVGPLVQRLTRLGVDLLAVYSVRQALDVLAHQPTCPVLVFMPAGELTPDADLRHAVRQGRIEFSVHDQPSLTLLSELARESGRAAALHLYVDTGMSRAGLSEQELPGVVAAVDACRHLRLAGLYTHFYGADSSVDSMRQQQQRFTAACAALPARPGLLLHVANTWAALRGRDYHQHMARIGLGLHGYGGELLTDRSGLNGSLPRLRPTLRWCSRIVHLRSYPAGANVGYNQTHTLRRDSRLALIPVGYGDGYPLSLSNRGVVMLCDPQGQALAAAPVVGKVNMDQLVIDVTDVPGEVHVGQLVELISADADSPCALPKLAALAGSHCYEMLCRLSPRLPRRYVGR